MKTSRNPAAIHPPLAAHSHQAKLTGPQRWLVLPGQIGMHQRGRLEGDPIEQFRLALADIERNLETAGVQKADLVKLTIYLVGEMDTVMRRRVLSEWLGGNRPNMNLLYRQGWPARRSGLSWKARPERVKAEADPGGSGGTVHRSHAVAGQPIIASLSDDGVELTA